MGSQTAHLYRASPFVLDAYNDNIKNTIFDIIVVNSGAFILLPLLFPLIF
jgi:hypothetical protein